MARNTSYHHGFIASNLDDWLMILTVVYPVLPDFYVWKMYYSGGSAISSTVIKLLWLAGVAMKLLSVIATSIYIIRNRDKVGIIILLPILLFLEITLSSAFTIEGLGVIRDNINQMINCLPALIALVALEKTDARLFHTAVLVSWTACFLVVTFTLLFYVVTPEGFGTLFGFHSFTDGRMQGNFLGIHEDTVSYGIVFVGLSILCARFYLNKKYLYVGTLEALLLMAFSTSSTALVVAAVIAVGVILRCSKMLSRLVYHLINPLLVYVVSVLISFAMPIATSMHSVQYVITQLLHRDATLTGRLPLYQTAISYIEENPVFGYGYSSEIFGRIFINSYGQQLTHPHNSFLQFALEGGFVALTIIFFIVYYYAVAHRQPRNQRASKGEWSTYYFRLLFVAFCIGALFYKELFFGRFWYFMGLFFVTTMLPGADSSLEWGNATQRRIHVWQKAFQRRTMPPRRAVSDVNDSRDSRAGRIQGYPAQEHEADGWQTAHRLCDRACPGLCIY